MPPPPKCQVCNGAGFFHPQNATAPHEKPNRKGKCAACVRCETCNGTGRPGGKGKLEDPSGTQQARGIMAACVVQ